MEKKEIGIKLAAGMFFLGGVVLACFVILTLGESKGLTRDKFQVTVLYKDVGGLSEGAPVRLAGVNIGNVSSIYFLDKAVEGRRVGVVMDIFTKYRRQLSRGAKFAIRTEGILGEKLVEITVLDHGGFLDIRRPILGEEGMNVQELAEVFAEAAESFTQTSQDLSRIDVQGLSRVVGETAQSLLVTSRGINKLLEELQEIAQKSKRLMNRIELKLIEGTLFKVF